VAFIFSSNLLDASSTASLRKAGSFVRGNERILRSVAIDGEPPPAGTSGRVTTTDPLSI